MAGAKRKFRRPTRSPAIETMNTILAPIDFSSITDRVVARAIALARATDARLVLLNVVSPIPIFGSSLARTTITGAELMAAAERRAANKLSRLQRTLHEDGVTAQATQISGTPVECILEQAQKLAANYIVLGSHGHTAIYDLFVGSTAGGVLKRATCPIVIVPPCADVVARSGDIAPAEAARA